MLNGFGLSQRKILERLLKNKEGLTIDAIVKSIDITRTAVNQHINSLEKDGYVKKHSQTKTRGRPSQIYILSEKGIHLFPKQYALFSALLLKSLKEKLGRDGLEKFLRELGEQVAKSYSTRLKGKSSTEKVMVITSIMEELGYESSVNNEGKNMIRACNCVYHDLATEIPEVCSFDLALISAMSGRKIKHVECMAQGNHKCSFKIKEALKTPSTSDYQIFEHPIN